MNNCQNTCSSGLKQLRLLQRNYSPLTTLHFTPVSQKTRAGILFKTLKGKCWKIHRRSASFQSTLLSTYLTPNFLVGLLGFHRRQKESQTILGFKRCLQHPLNGKKELEVAAELMKCTILMSVWILFSLSWSLWPWSDVPPTQVFVRVLLTFFLFLVEFQGLINNIQDNYCYVNMLLFGAFQKNS